VSVACEKCHLVECTRIRNVCVSSIHRLFSLNFQQSPRFIRVLHIVWHGSSGPVPEAYKPAVTVCGSTRLANQRGGTSARVGPNEHFLQQQNWPNRSQRAPSTNHSGLHWFFFLTSTLQSTVTTIWAKRLDITTLRTVTTAYNSYFVLPSLQTAITSLNSTHRLVYVMGKSHTYCYVEIWFAYVCTTSL